MWSKNKIFIITILVFVVGAAIGGFYLRKQLRQAAYQNCLKEAESYTAENWPDKISELYQQKYSNNQNNQFGLVISSFVKYLTQGQRYNATRKSAEATMTAIEKWPEFIRPESMLSMKKSLTALPHPFYAKLAVYSYEELCANDRLRSELDGECLVSPAGGREFFLPLGRVSKEEMEAIAKQRCSFDFCGFIKKSAENLTAVSDQLSADLKEFAGWSEDQEKDKSTGWYNSSSYRAWILSFLYRFKGEQSVGDYCNSHKIKSGKEFCDLKLKSIGTLFSVRHQAKSDLATEKDQLKKSYCGLK